MKTKSLLSTVTNLDLTLSLCLTSANPFRIRGYPNMGIAISAIIY